MLNRLFITTILVTIFTNCNAQYYYKDLLNGTEVKKELLALKKANIHLVKINSYEPGGDPTADFFCEKKINKDFNKVTVQSKSPESGESLMISKFDENVQLIETYDSSEIVVSENHFSYNQNHLLTNILSISKSNDDDFKTEIYEEHIYHYDSAFNPTDLQIVKNKKDTLLILFSLDENKKVSVEKDTKTAFKYYYYYDEKERITDIVHSNAYTQKPVVDYVFEYNTNGEIVTMTSAANNPYNTLIWKYDYENGLRVKERAFSGDQKFLGKIEYSYK